jgi:hypothetical protein
MEMEIERRDGETRWSEIRQQADADVMMCGCGVWVTVSVGVGVARCG